MGHTGSGYPGPTGTGTFKNADIFEDHVAFASEPPSLMESGLHALPNDVRDAFRVIPGQSPPRTVESSEDRLNLEFKAQRLMPELKEIRGGLNFGRFET